MGWVKEKGAQRKDIDYDSMGEEKNELTEKTNGEETKYEKRIRNTRLVT